MRPGLQAVQFALVVTVLYGCHNGAPARYLTDGPLEIPPDHGWRIIANPGQTFTDGLEILQVNGLQAVTIEKVEFVGGDPGLELVGAQVATTDRGNGSIQFDPSYPPASPGRFGKFATVPGAVVKPLGGEEIGDELFLGVRVQEDGRFVRQGIRIIYRVGNVEYVAYFPAQLVVRLFTVEGVAGV